MPRPDCTEALKATLAKRIMIMDGAMGTMVQLEKLSEEDFRGVAIGRIRMRPRPAVSVLHCAIVPDAFHGPYGTIFTPYACMRQ